MKKSDSQASIVLAPLLVLLYSYFFPVEMSAQLILGARNTSLGQAVTALPQDQWALFGNPSLLATHTESSASFYAIRYYELSELSDISSNIIQPFGGFVLSAAVHRYGFDLFSENRIQIGAAKGWDKIRAGAGVTWHHVSIGGDYGSAGTALVNAGLSTDLSSQVMLGFRAYNMLDSRLGESAAEIAREIALGLSYRPSPRILISSDLVKDIRYPLSVRSGVEATFLDVFALRAGFTTEPNTFSFGVGIFKGSLKANIVAQRHEFAELGTSPGIDISWSW